MCVFFFCVLLVAKALQLRYLLLSDDQYSIQTHTYIYKKKHNNRLSLFEKKPVPHLIYVLFHLSIELFAHYFIHISHLCESEWTMFRVCACVCVYHSHTDTQTKLICRKRKVLFADQYMHFFRSLVEFPENLTFMIFDSLCVYTRRRMLTFFSRKKNPIVQRNQWEQSLECDAFLSCGTYQSYHFIICIDERRMSTELTVVHTICIASLLQLINLKLASIVCENCIHELSTMWLESELWLNLYTTTIS